MRFLDKTQQPPPKVCERAREILRHLKPKKQRQ